MTTNNSPHEIEIKCFRNKRLEDVPLLYEAAYFFLEELLKNYKRVYPVNVKVKLSNGTVVAEDGSLNDGTVIRELANGIVTYTIELSNQLPFFELVSTIAHEMTHVVQFERGYLTFQGDNWIWKGTDYGTNPYKVKNVDKELPWEYDAVCKEISLTRKFVKKHLSNW